MGAPADVVSIEDTSATSFICNNSDPVWYNQEGLMFPECSGNLWSYPSYGEIMRANKKYKLFLVTTIPTDVEQNGSVTVKSKPGFDVCADTKQLNEVDICNNII